MKYLDTSCPVCQHVFDENSDVVVCPVCGTPHHRECFKNNGACVNESKHAEGFEWTCSTEDTEPVKETSVQDAEKEVLGNICPRCGDNCPKDFEICPNCGKRLSDAEDFDNSSQEIKEPLNNFGTIISPSDTLYDIPVSEFAQYLQYKSHKYIPKFFRMEKLKQKFSWNGGVFFSTLLFNPFWFFTKKLYLAGTIFALIYLAVNAVSYPIRMAFLDLYNTNYQSVLNAIEAYGNSSAQAVDAMNAFVQQIPLSYIVIISLYFLSVILIAVVAGIIGNTLYLNKARKDIHSSREESDDFKTYQLLLEKKGKPALFFAILVWLLVRAIINFTFMYIPNFLL